MVCLQLGRAVVSEDVFVSDQGDAHESLVLTAPSGMVAVGGGCYPTDASTTDYDELQAFDGPDPTDPTKWKFELNALQTTGGVTVRCLLVAVNLEVAT